MTNVMIVDDDRLARLGLINSVEWESYAMTVTFDTPNGEEALEFAASNRVDLAFIDLEMPGMFGLDLLKKLVRLSPGTKCVIVTMHDEFSYIQEALRIGILDYIIKTELGGEEIARVVRRLRKRLDSYQEQQYFGETLPGEKEFSYEIRRSIKQAVDMVLEGKGQYISAKDMAEKVNMSRSYFSTCFKQLVGTSFNEYFREVRLEQAKKRLIHSDDTVSMIAWESGFSDESYFSTVFKNYTGMPPTEFRKKNISE
ncbi:MAG: helix-turn-helix domain-containing protein [Spirochaetales bacterium]|nr:helix-turn-helix domain-containing protein [Spirochaetales bacterium]